MRHFHEKLREVHGIELSYTWVQKALQGAGLVAKRHKRGPHRGRRPRRPLPGMLVHIDGNKHQWFNDDRWHDLICAAGRCNDRNLLRAIGRGRVDADGDDESEGGRRNRGVILRTIQ